ncbi:MAG: type II toxin-antitoxin system death-on-curing family toxin [Chloroflexi bacterium]|jgi:death-on-curing protein|nr:type II toxin-antitoxin system death-on-curing family toxin [Chloroflexota bacterium]
MKFRYLELGEVLQLYLWVMRQSGGTVGIRDLGLLESALVQPRATFGGIDLYPTIAEKAAAIGFSLIKNHPFVDGNKRIGHAAMEVFLMLNGYEIEANVDEQERIIRDLAAGNLNRETFVSWLREHIVTESGDEML